MFSGNYLKECVVIPVRILGGVSTGWIISGGIKLLNFFEKTDRSIAFGWKVR